MRFFFILCFIFSTCLFGSCDIINPSEQIPTYIHVDSFQFITTPQTGTSSHKITSVDAYVDLAPIGTFDLPADIPILADKPSSIMLIPAVPFSGLSQVITYPYYRVDTFTLNPAPGKRIVVTPKTQYWGDSVLNFTHEDFESGNSFINLEGDTLRRTTNPAYVFEGGYGGVIEVKDSMRATNIMSVSFQAPSQASDKTEAYLEINYKGTLPFVVGLQTTDNGVEVLRYLYGFNARSSWNKVYIGLSDFLSQYQNKSYRVVVQTSMQNGNTGYVAFDNFKIVTRK